MRGTVLIAIAALFVSAQVAVAQELGRPNKAPQATSFEVDGKPARQASAVEQRQAPGARVERAEATGLTATVGGLPLTGLDMLVIGGAALVLAGTGFAIAGLTRPSGRL